MNRSGTSRKRVARTRGRLVRRWAPTLAVGLGLVALAFHLSGCHPCRPGDDCDACDDCWWPEPDYTPPGVPTCLWSVTGDGEVLLIWCANGESDLAGYRIYRSTRSEGYFPRIASVGRQATSFADHDVRNGETYWYVISAVDEAGNESGLTPDAIHDTPRPEGTGLRLYNAQVEPERSGYDFSRYDVLDYRELEADLYYWYSEDSGPWMIATERTSDRYTDIQDAGYVALDDVDWAPAEGWAPNGEVPLIEGHAYVVWTWDDHYAKFRVASITSDRVLVEWAYQTDPGNPELFHPGGRPAVKSAAGGLRTHQKGEERRIAS